MYKWSQRVEVRVSNSSSGIPTYSRHVEGIGLSLSVSQEIARAHGNDIVLKSQVFLGLNVLGKYTAAPLSLSR